MGVKNNSEMQALLTVCSWKGLCSLIQNFTEDTDLSFVCCKHLFFYSKSKKVCSVKKKRNHDVLLFHALPPSMIAPSTTRWPRMTDSTFGGWNISTSLFTAMCARACCWVWGSKGCAAPVSTWSHQKRATPQWHRHHSDIATGNVVSRLRLAQSFLD